MQRTIIFILFFLMYPLTLCAQHDFVIDDEYGNRYYGRFQEPMEVGERYLPYENPGLKAIDEYNRTKRESERLELERQKLELQRRRLELEENRRKY